jgi:ketosteroid isomerase-like protein
VCHPISHPEILPFGQASFEAVFQQGRGASDVRREARVDQALPGTSGRYGGRRLTMKRQVLTFVALLVLPGSTNNGLGAGSKSTKTQQPNNSVVAEIKSLENARLAAGLSKDIDAVSAMTADDYLQIDTDGRVLNKAVTLERIKSSYARLVANPVDDLAVRVYGDTAILTARARPQGVLDGKEFTDALRYTRIYVKRDGRWQVVLFQQTRVVDSTR